LPCQSFISLCNYADFAAGLGVPRGKYFSIRRASLQLALLTSDDDVKKPVFDPRSWKIAITLNQGRDDIQPGDGLTRKGFPLLLRS